MTDALLISADEDVRVGVVLAQQFGVRVHLVGIHPSLGNQSRSLYQEADTVTEWDKGVIHSFLKYLPPIIPSTSSPESKNVGLDSQIKAIIAALPPAEVVSLKERFVAGDLQIPQEYDRVLLRIGRIHFGETALSTAERTQLRTSFIRHIQGV